MEEQQRRELFALNEFMKFERRLYQFAGFKFGRDIKLKSVLYVLTFSAILFGWYHLPILNIPLRILPDTFLYTLPFILTYLLMDVGTENRPPIKFLKSFIAYNLRRSKKVTYFKGMVLEKPKAYGFRGQLPTRTFPAKKKKPNPTYGFHGQLSVSAFPVKKKKPNPTYQFQGYFTIGDG